MEVQIGKPSASKVYWINIFHLHLLEKSEEGNDLIHEVKDSDRIAPNLKYSARSPLNKQWT